MGPLLAVVAKANAQVLAVGGVEEHLSQTREGGVADLDLVAAEAEIDAEEEAIDLYVGELAMDGAEVAQERGLAAGLDLFERIVDRQNQLLDAKTVDS